MRENDAGARAAPRGTSLDDADRRSTLYLCRRERKYEVEPALAAQLRRAIENRLPLFSFIPGQHDSYITTVYFDTRNRDLFHRASRSFDNNFKIRVKEYYYAGRNDDALRDGDGRGRRDAFYCSRFCFVELKQRRDGIVFKRRFRLPKEQVGRLFSGEDVGEHVFDGLTGKARLSVEKTYGALRRYLGKSTVEVSSVVCYHRLVYQKSERELRITFDDQVAVHPPPVGLYGEFEALTPDVLGSPIRTLDRVIMEIKCSGDYPPWLTEALMPLSAKRLSKFTSSVRLLMESRGQERDAPARLDADGSTGN